MSGPSFSRGFRVTAPAQNLALVDCFPPAESGLSGGAGVPPARLGSPPPLPPECDTTSGAATPDDAFTFTAPPGAHPGILNRLVRVVQCDPP